MKTLRTIALCCFSLSAATAAGQSLNQGSAVGMPLVPPTVEAVPPASPLDVPPPPRAVVGPPPKHAIQKPASAVAPEVVASPPSPDYPLDAPQPAGCGLGFYRNRVVTPNSASRSTTGEPSCAINQDTVFQTGNWYAALSTDTGQTWTHINPATRFAALDGGFCCDQRAVYVPSHDITIWLLQYSFSSTTGRGSMRVAVARGRDNLRANTWVSFTFSTAAFPLLSTNTFLDFPDVAFSRDHLWLSANVYNDSSVYVNSVVWRVNLADLANGTSLPGNYWLRSGGAGNLAGASFRFAQQATGGTMYFASTNVSPGLRVYRTADGSATVRWTDYTVTAWSASNYSSRTCDGREWCELLDDRVLAGYCSLPDNEIGFLWCCAQLPSRGRPHPYTRVVRINTSTLAVIAEHEIWSNTLAKVYPAVTTNAAGHVGGVMAVGGPADCVHSSSFIVDDCDSWPPATVGSATGTNGPALSGSPPVGRWGDYFSVQRHPTSPATFVGTGMELNGGPTGSFLRPRFLWFGRDSNAPTPVTLTVTSTPVTGVAITVDATDINGNKNGTTDFTRTYMPRQGYQLTAPARVTDARGRRFGFQGWTLNGAAQTPGVLTLTQSSIGTAADAAEARYAEAIALTITSEPILGFGITVSPADLDGRASGDTSFTRAYFPGTAVTLTAPFWNNGQFSRWRRPTPPRGYVLYPEGQRSVTVLPDDNWTLEAVYLARYPGAMTQFGQGCAGSLGQRLQQVGSGTPDIGQTVTYNLTNGPRNGAALLLLGFSTTLWSGVSLPWSLGTLAPGCTIYNDMVIAISVPIDATGRGAVPIRLGSGTNLIGGHHYTQFWGLEPGLNNVGLSFSNSVDTLYGGLR